MNLGENIRKFRKLKNMSAKTLGDRLNCSGQAILQYERNERKPSIDILNKIAKELDVPSISLTDPDYDISNMSIINKLGMEPVAHMLIQSIVGNDSESLERLSKLASNDINLSSISLKYSDIEKKSLLNLIKQVDEDINLDSIDNGFLNNLFEDIYDLIEFKLYKHSKNLSNK